MFSRYATRVRRVVFSLAAQLLILLPLTNLASAQTQSSAVPRLVQFSGIINVHETPRAGVIGLTFALYKDEQGGAPVWLETQNAKLDSSGHYSVQLGATLPNGLPQELFDSGEARWLGVQLAGQPEQPRVLLLSVPYALKAADAETLGGLPLSAFVLASPLAAPSRAAAPATSASSSLSPSLAGTGTTNFLPLWTSSTALGSSVLFQSGTGSTARIGIGNTTPAATLDVTGGATIRGLLNLPNAATATATAGADSRPFGLVASTYNSSTKAAANQLFHWQAEPIGNNTATPSATLNLLFATAPAAAAETGLKINHLGQITFAPGQTFPGAGGTITGVTAGTGLTGGGTSGNVTLNLDTTKVPLLSTANVFTRDQSVAGNFTASGTVSGSVVNASVLDVGGSAIAFGSPSSLNAFLGFAGGSVNTGTLNTGTGVQVLFSNTSGSANTATGAQAMARNITGTNNTAYGNQALALNTDGYYNTAVGALALFNTQGYYNTGVGLQTLTNNTTGNYNVGFGYNAGPDTTTQGLTNSAAIGSYADVSQSNSLVLGSIKGINGASADTLVGIGTTAPAAKLDVHGTANFTGAITFAASQTFPGTGTITSVTAGTDLTGGGTPGGVTLTLDTTKVPLLASANSFAASQTVAGNITASGTSTANVINAATAYYLNGAAFAFASNTSVFLGYAGNSATTGIENTGIGDEALQSVAAGGGNTAIGYQALVSDSIGGGNTAIGSFALGAADLGIDNTATGSQALQNNGSGLGNTADGLLALNSNTAGNFKTASGNGALKLTTGNNNTGIGYNALLTNSIGSFNTAIGSSAGPDSAHNNLTNATAIGANAVVSASNALVLGGTGANAVSVGIGTATPVSTLDVRGTGKFTGLVTFASGQTFPGTGTITGVAAGTALTGGGTTGNVTLNVDTTKVVTGIVAGTDLTGGGTGGNVTLNLNTSATDARYAQLSAPNVFTGAQTIDNGLTVSAGLATVLNVTSTITGNHAPIAAFGDNFGDANSVRVFQGGSTGSFTEMFVAAPGTFITGTLDGDGR